jgi:hypothetical protein
MAKIWPKPVAYIIKNNNEVVSEIYNLSDSCSTARWIPSKYEEF